MEKYPFLSLIKSKLRERGESNNRWLASEVGKSARWVDIIEDIEDITLGDIIRISKALEFDFLADYYKWLGKYGLPVMQLVGEPAVVYEKPGKGEIKMQITIVGNPKNATKILQTIQAEGVKQGYKID